MNNKAERLDYLIQSYKSGKIDRKTAFSESAPIIMEINKKKIKRERNTGREPKLFSFEKLFIQNKV